MVGQSSHRVLLVDDDVLLRKVITRQLLAAGYLVRTAEHGLDAIAKLRAGLPDLIISDVNMPEMDGVEFLGVVRKRFPHIPLIAMSGIDEREVTEGLVADAFCPKNAIDGFPELLATIADLAGKSASRAPIMNLDDVPAPARWNGNGRYVLDCDECLREFAVSTSVFPRGKNDNLTICVHCGNFVPLVVAAGIEGDSLRACDRGLADQPLT